MTKLINIKLNNYYSIPNKFNRYLILIFTVAPFVAYITVTYLDVSFNRIMQLLSYIGVVLILIFKDKNSKIKFPKYLLFYLLFIIYVFFSTFVLLDREFKIMYLFSNFLIGGFNMMFIIENIKISKKDYYLILNISKNILIIAVIVIVIQQVYKPYFFVRTDLIGEDDINDITERLPSIYSWVGGLTMGFGFIPVFILIVEELDKRKKKIIIWIIAGILFAFLTKARWVLLNALLVLVILFVNYKNKTLKFVKFAFFAPILFGVIIVSLDFSGINATGILKERILESDKKDISQTTAGTRVLALYALNKFFWDNPVLGKGNIKFGMGGTGKQDYKLRKFLGGRSSQIHVGYASLLYMYGLIGALFFLSFLILILKKLYKTGKILGVWAPFLGFLGIALANLTLVYFMIFEMGLIIVLVADRYYNLNTKLRIKRIDK